MRDNRTALGCHGQFQDEFIGRIPKNRAPKEMNVLPMTDAAQVIHESDDLAPAEAEFVRMSPQDRLVFQDERDRNSDLERASSQQAQYMK